MVSRILHILGSLAIGGAESLVLDMVRQGHKYGFELFVVHMHKVSDERTKCFEESGAVVKYIPCKKGIKGTSSFIYNLNKYLKNNKIECIHCHNNIDAYWAFMASCGLKCKIILSVHGFNLDLDYLKNKLHTWPFFYPDKYILQRCSIAFVSGRTKDFYSSKYAGWNLIENAPVIHNGIDATKVTQAEKVDLISSGVPLCNVEALCNVETLCNGISPFVDAPLFAMVGSFNSPAKRQQLILCKAIGELKKRFAGALPFNFAFIGASNSNYDTRLQTTAENEEDMYAACRIYCAENDLDNNIKFFAPRADVPGIMRNLGCYVYSSLDDTFGLSVIEAVIAGAPVICSDIPTFREVTLNGLLATLVPNNPEAFAESMFNFITEAKMEDGEIRKIEDTEMRKQTALKKYSIEACILNYKKIYEITFKSADL